MAPFAKTAAAVGSIVALNYLVPPFHAKMDRNIYKPIRNYRRLLQSTEDFQHQEDFHKFLRELSSGFLHMFMFENLDKEDDE